VSTVCPEGSRTGSSITAVFFAWLQRFNWFSRGRADESVACSLGILQVLSTQPTPIITGFSPSSATIGLFENTISTTILGSGFADYDTVEISGPTVPSSFVDSSHIQATIPYQFTGAAGSLPSSLRT
jgi:hypothetical protein